MCVCVYVCSLAVTEWNLENAFDLGILDCLAIQPSPDQKGKLPLLMSTSPVPRSVCNPWDYCMRMCKILCKIFQIPHEMTFCNTENVHRRNMQICMHVAFSTCNNISSGSVKSCLGMRPAHIYVKWKCYSVIASCRVG